MRMRQIHFILLTLALSASFAVADSIESLNTQDPNLSHFKSSGPRNSTEGQICLDCIELQYKKQFEQIETLAAETTKTFGLPTK